MLAGVTFLVMAGQGEKNFVCHGDTSSIMVKEPLNTDTPKCVTPLKARSEKSIICDDHSESKARSYKLFQKCINGENRMDKLLQLKVFVRLAERGSFSAVGRDMGVTQPSVSKAITALERSLGVRLVNRSTRSVSLTVPGSRYYAHCRKILAELEEADAAVSQSNLDAVGTLKIAAPVPFGLTFITPRVARFQVRYPALQLDLDLDDRPVNLVEENIDVAIRLGHLTAPGLAARKLGDSPFVTVASPDYLTRSGMPRTPAELKKHNCLTYTRQTNPSAWDFEANKTVNVAGHYRSNNLLALKDAAIAGVGIAQLPLWMVDAEIKAGSLRVVLEKFRVAPFGIHAVFPSVKQIPAKVRLFVDFIQSELSSVPFFPGVRSPLSRAVKR
jgi:LysR family transcriptional regulator for bpeEF and oprC